jgi:hypothetical protein
VTDQTNHAKQTTHVKRAKQAEQPGPGEAQIRRTASPVADSRPTKGPALDTPDAARPSPFASSGPVKGEGAPRPVQGADRPTKAPVDADAVASATPGATGSTPGDQRSYQQFPDQEPPGGGRSPRHPATEGGAEQYVRLRLRVRGDRLSVVDSHLVDGPLGQVAGFPGANAYEVTLGDRLLHAGALPDLGVQRSFVNPEGPAEQRRHFVTERDVYEFVARVPANEVTPETLGELRVTLHRVKEEARAPRLTAEPLGRQFERQLRPVAELVGLPESVLPAAIEERGGRTPAV